MHNYTVTTSISQAWIWHDSICHHCVKARQA